MAVGFPTKVNYATGDVLTATNMNDLSGTVNILEGTQYSGGKNRVINGAFQVWQRGTSIATSSSATNYTADRWIANKSTGTGTVSRQTTSDTTNLPNIQYCARVQRTAADTTTTAILFINPFETINTIPLVGKTVVMSFYARAGANFSAASNLLSFSVSTGTGTDQNPFSYTGSTTPVAGSATLTTTWQRFTATGTIATTATELYVAVSYVPVGTAGVNDYFEITGVQLEASTTAASAFATNGGTYQAELAACQRYYWRSTADASNPYALFAPSGYMSSTTAGTANLLFPVAMRVVPTSVDYSSIAVQNTAGTISNITAFTTTNQSTLLMAGINVTTGATVTNLGFRILGNNSASAYVGFSAEL